MPVRAASRATLSITARSSATARTTGADDSFSFELTHHRSPAYGCLLELTIQLVVLMVVKNLISHVMEVGACWHANTHVPQVVIPLIKARLRRKKNQTQPLTPWEQQARHCDRARRNECHMLQWRELDAAPPRALFNEYMALIVQFGYVTLFITAFPLAPVFALINNIFEIRIDSEKFIVNYRLAAVWARAGLISRSRGPALRSEDIGTWESASRALPLTADHVRRDRADCGCAGGPVQRRGDCLLDAVHRARRVHVRPRQV